jgi:hypothetical protein
MTTRNGYESKDHWQTALWLNNDESLYNLMVNETEKAVYMQQSIADAIANIIKQLPEKTPDGADWRGDTIADLVLENYNEQLQHS